MENPYEKKKEKRFVERRELNPHNHVRTKYSVKEVLQFTKTSF